MLKKEEKKVVQISSKEKKNLNGKEKNVSWDIWVVKCIGSSKSLSENLTVIFFSLVFGPLITT